jgi:hypothetical protein
MTDNKNIHDQEGFHVKGTGSACGRLGRVNSDGFWAPPTNVNGCPSGQSFQLHLVHTCQGVCESGNWTWEMKTHDIGIYGTLEAISVPTCVP